MARIYDDATALIGNTPLVRINKITDGVHPTPAGHGLLAEAWLNAVGLG